MEIKLKKATNGCVQLANGTPDGLKKLNSRIRKMFKALYK